MFTLSKKVIAITGGGGALASVMSTGLASMGATIISLDRNIDAARQVVSTLPQGKHAAYPCDVLDKDAFEKVMETIVNDHGRIDILINAAGGNMSGATIGPDQNYHDIEIEHLNKVMQLNVQGTMIPASVVSKIMIQQGHGHIINISSMSAQQPLTRVVGYSASKAAIDNFTKWLSVELASKHGESFRVNAIAPGFFIGEQNRRLLLEEDGSLTARGHTIISQTPMGRFGDAEELVGTMVWLCSDASRFVTGTIIPVDGGFSAFSGV
jgi:NAD(P)-dependent dehydrogenase (short-subunit alcohol dehydrogenase family)